MDYFMKEEEEQVYRDGALAFGNVNYDAFGDDLGFLGERKFVASPLARFDEMGGEREEVYRSVSCLNQPPTSRFFGVEQRSMSCGPLFADFEEDGLVKKKKEMDQQQQQQQQSFEYRTCPLDRPLGRYVPTSLHCFSDINNGSMLVKRMKTALTDAEADWKDYDESNGSIQCVFKGCRFDVYILATDDNRHIIEVQKVYSMMSPAEWAGFVKTFFLPVADICYGGFFEAPAFARTAVNTNTMLKPLPLFQEEEEQPLVVVSDEELIDEYEKMIEQVSCAETSFENRIAIAKLLAELSKDSETAKKMTKFLTKVLKLLQHEVLRDARNLFVQMLCVLLTNLGHAVEKDVVDTTTHVTSSSYSTAAYTTSRLLAQANLDDPFELDILRDASKALATFSKKLDAGFRGPVREAAIRCAYSHDARLSANARVVLQNVNAY